MKKENKYNNNIYMKNGKMKTFSRLLTILCIIFAVVVVGLTVYMLYNLYDNYRADKEAEELMSQFEDIYVEEKTLDTENENVTEEQVNEVTEEQPSTNTTTNTNTNKTTIKPSYGIGTYYKGYKVIGTISIPRLNIQYPIFSVDNTATLRVGTAAIYPANMEQALNKPGNVVIAGHNYRNSRMFSKLHTLQNGDSIYITNISGQKLEYKVYNNYTADENDFTYATRDTGEAIEISLSTCTNNSRTRTVIWAKVQ